MLLLDIVDGFKQKGEIYYIVSNFAQAISITVVGCPGDEIEILKKELQLYLSDRAQKGRSQFNNIFYKLGAETICDCRFEIDWPIA